jgi:hypothetical protein
LFLKPRENFIGGREGLQSLSFHAQGSQRFAHGEVGFGNFPCRAGAGRIGTSESFSLG